MTVELEGLTPRIEGGSDGEEALPPRRLRADGQRNRERLTEVAKLAFAELGADVSLDEIARRAGVGIGTLYRHFPTRDAIIEAVYRREVEQLAGSAARLLASLSPGEALHEWMRLFVDYIATKKVMASAIGAIVANTPELYASSLGQITNAMVLLVDRASVAGDIRPNVDPNDLLRALVGFTYGNTSPGWQASALRLIDILIDGLRPPRPAD
ncbi:MULTISPECIES: TetR/AcrR family transcriptional regulator [unclassified Acidisoma]|jgi:AcrR family transcriptional regulator|uniref:TetR/AcrR family transcriptional regulator n=1 Tax=unclassified Acidisoma TaxID=2634065 RepID=UPI00131DAF39|nr:MULTISPECIES: TetR/AcrR family transcriptional regulator [unclassified Acidisoma]